MSLQRVNQVSVTLIAILLGGTDGRPFCSAADAANPDQQTESSPQPVRITNDGLLKQRPRWSPDGLWLVFARHRGDSIFLFLRSRDGATERRLTKRTAPEYDAVWSPDGKRLAFSAVKQSPNQGDLEVYTIGVDGESLTPIAETGGKLSHEESPSWSHDGEWIAYSSTRDGNQEIYIARSDGSDARRLTNDNALDAHPAISPDGKQVAFATSRWGDWELAVVDIAEGTTTRLTESRGLDDYPAWSPDGKHLAFTSNRDGNLEIYVRRIDSASAQNVTRHAGIDNFPSWSPDGRITFVSNRDGGFDVYELSPSLP